MAVVSLPPQGHRVAQTYGTTEHTQFEYAYTVWISPSGATLSSCAASCNQQCAKAHEAWRYEMHHQVPFYKSATAETNLAGYQDSGSDIAFNLKERCSIDVLAPHAAPDPGDQTHWCFPDTESGILAAVNAGATHLWANTIVHTAHPLQESSKLLEHLDRLSIVGQPPCLVELYDDKLYVNDWLRTDPQFSMPRGWSLTQESASSAAAQIESLELPYPIVAKPCRGRGSAGVKLCHTPAELAHHVENLYADSSVIMLEEYLQGEEATVTVMPPSSSKAEYWAMPIVKRFNHQDGVAPYNGTVAVSSNSRAISSEEFAVDCTYAEVARQCEAVAKLLRATAPIRIDVRRRDDNAASPFVLFDINMKPVSFYCACEV